MTYATEMQPISTTGYSLTMTTHVYCPNQEASSLIFEATASSGSSRLRFPGRHFEVAIIYAFPAEFNAVSFVPSVLAPTTNSRVPPGAAAKAAGRMRLNYIKLVLMWCTVEQGGSCRGHLAGYEMFRFCLSMIHSNDIVLRTSSSRSAIATLQNIQNE